MKNVPLDFNDSSRSSSCRAFHPPAVDYSTFMREKTHSANTWKTHRRKTSEHDSNMVLGNDVDQPPERTDGYGGTLLNGRPVMSQRGDARSPAFLPPPPPLLEKKKCGCLMVCTCRHAAVKEGPPGKEGPERGAGLHPSRPTRTSHVRALEHLVKTVVLITNGFMTLS